MVHNFNIFGKNSPHALEGMDLLVESLLGTHFCGCEHFHLVRCLEMADFYPQKRTAKKNGRLNGDA